MVKVGLDMDYTITSYPKEFAKFSRQIYNQGGEVFIITFRPENLRLVTKDELKFLGIRYSKIFLWDYDKNWSEGAGEYKRKIAKKLNLDLMIDDDFEVLHAMPASVNTCLANVAARRIRNGDPVC